MWTGLGHWCVVSTVLSWLVGVSDTWITFYWNPFSQKFQIKVCDLQSVTSARDMLSVDWSFQKQSLVLLPLPQSELSSGEPFASNNSPVQILEMLSGDKFCAGYFVADINTLHWP
ncbi:unnamed protein product [Calypogeia fissa]